MQKTESGIQTGAAHGYRERLSPSLWVLASAALIAPMVALVVTPIDRSLALAAGGVAGILFIALLVASSPVVSVRDRELRAGRAHIAAEHLGEPRAYTGDEARRVRGPGLQARSWHLIRGGIDGIVVVPITDADDPTPEWVISTRTPDRLAAAIRRARASS